jgi:hypothetical protein
MVDWDPDAWSTCVHRGQASRLRIASLHFIIPTTRAPLISTAIRSARYAEVIGITHSSSQSSRTISSKGTKLQNSPAVRLRYSSSKEETGKLNSLASWTLMLCPQPQSAPSTKYQRKRHLYPGATFRELQAHQGKAYHHAAPARTLISSCRLVSSSLP